MKELITGMDRTWITLQIPVNGFNLAVYRSGEHKPPLVMLHGFTDDSGCWLNLAKTLTDKYEVILIDEIGHGRSDRVKKLPNRKTYDPPQHVHAVIQHLKLFRPILLGHSMGAATAARFAANYPDLPAAVMLEDLPWIDPSPNQTAPTNHQKEPYFFKLQKMQTQTLEEVIAYGFVRHPRWRKESIPPWAEAKLRFDLDFYELRPPFRPDYNQLLPKIKAPTLIISGDPGLGSMITAEKAQTALKIMSHAQWAKIPNAGHCIRYEQFDAYLQVVKAFLEKAPQ